MSRSILHAFVGCDRDRRAQAIELRFAPDGQRLLDKPTRASTSTGISLLEEARVNPWLASTPSHTLRTGRAHGAHAIRIHRLAGELQFDGLCADVCARAFGHLLGRVRADA